MNTSTLTPTPVSSTRKDSLLFGVNLAAHHMVTTSRELRRADRCDRCSAQAFVRAEKGSSELLMCGYHGRQHVTALVDQGFIIDDQTHRVNDKPSVSANA